MDRKKKCPCKKANMGKRSKAAVVDKSQRQMTVIRAPISTKVHHTKNSTQIAQPKLNRGRVQYQF